MSAWCIDSYGTNEVLRFSEEIPMPTVTSPTDVMIQVHATSLNPLDVAMRGKWLAGDTHGEHEKTLKAEVVTQLLRCFSALRWLRSQTAEIEEGSHVSDGKRCRVPSDPGP